MVAKNFYIKNLLVKRYPLLTKETNTCGSKDSSVPKPITKVCSSLSDKKWANLYLQLEITFDTLKE